MIDIDGKFSYYPNILQVEVIVSLSFFLFQNTPNPFKSETQISYQITAFEHVKIEIYDIEGQQINTLVDEEEDAGYYAKIWKARDILGFDVPSGLYLCMLRVGASIDVKKMLLLK